jgi:hypothetical protein
VASGKVRRTPAAFAPEVIADQVIAQCGGDARAAVKELVTVIAAPRGDNEALTAASSLGYARRAPRRQLVRPEGRKDRSLAVKSERGAAL